MKIIDRNGRVFGKISIIDVLVIAVVLVMAAALAFKDKQTHTGASVTEQPITFQLRVQGVEDYLADAIRVDEVVYDPNNASGGRPVGTITRIEVEREPGLRLSDGLLDGSLSMLEVEGTRDLLITVEGSGLVTDGRYFINRVYELGVNAVRSYTTSRAVFGGTVTAIG